MEPNLQRNSLTNPVAMNVDDVLAHAGDFHRYQWLLLALFSALNVVSAFHYFAQTFISLVPEAICRTEPWRRIPGEQCFFRDDNDTLKACEEWDFRQPAGFYSIVSEYSWVCQDDWKPALGQSLYFVGAVLGSLGLGVTADHVGRLPVLVLANLVALLGNVVTAFTTDLWQFAAARLVAGIATDCNFLMMYIIVMEYMRPDMRTLGLNLCIGAFYCAGSVAVPWLAAAMTTWRRFLLAGSMPMILAPALYWIVPESARWLVQRGRVNEAIKCFQRIARFNGREIPVHALDGFKSANCKVEESCASLFGLFRTPKLRRKTCILIFKSVVLTVCYDAISRNVQSVGYDPMIVFSISSATILPSCIVILMLQDRMGRKAMASCSLLLTGLFMAGSGIFLATSANESTSLVPLVLAVVGRFAVNIAYNSGAQYAAELIPTVVRGQGVAAIHVAGYAATFFSPHILYLGTFWHALPEILIGVLAVGGAALCLLLPETAGRALPVTLQDGEDFGEGEGFCEFMCCGGKTA